MPLFITDEELLQSDPSQVAAKADLLILDLRRQLETALAEADAASITSDLSYNVLEQRYNALSTELARAQDDAARFSATTELRLSELADAQAAKHDLHVKCTAKDGEIVRLKVEVSELCKSNRQLLELISNKDTEIGEKDAVIQNYFDKIVKLTEDANEKEKKLMEKEAEVSRCRATCVRYLQEKELMEKHNTCLNDELSEKVNNLIDFRRKYTDFEADMACKLAEVERRSNECSRSLKLSEGKVKEYSTKLASAEEELRDFKNKAAVIERQYATELSTVTKLVELYKESSETWSKKAADLEGVIKALEMHLSQVELDYKAKLEEETSAKTELEKEIQSLREKLDMCETKLEQARKASEKDLLLGCGQYADAFMEDVSSEAIQIGNQNESTIIDVYRKPIGISGTALAASLLRDGWSLAKMYEKYQEAADALRHEKWGRRNTEAILERVLHEIEAKADIILEERAEHEKMADAYISLNKKLQQAQLEHDSYEASIRNLKAELKQYERDHNIIEKENTDLQRQVTVLLKECRDIQIRCGLATNEMLPPTENVDDVDTEQLTFKGIMELVQQNFQLKRIVTSLSSANENHLSDMRKNFQMELQKQENEAASRVEAVLKRCEEQGIMIESLHNSVAMYKKLYEVEHSTRKSEHNTPEPISGGNKDVLLLLEGSQEVAKKAHEEVIIRARSLEQDLSNLRNELLAIKLERDKFAMEAKHARERLNDFTVEFDCLKNESNGVSARNVELSQLIIDHQKRLRESSDSLHASEEKCRKLSVEVSVLRNEREVLVNSEKRASNEIQNLTERVYRLQSSLDTFHAVQEVHEESRLREQRRLEERVHRAEKEWADAKKELQGQRDHCRLLEAERERTIEESTKQVNEMRKALSDALTAVSRAEARAVSAEARLANFECLMKADDEEKQSGKENVSSSLVHGEGNEDLRKMHEEMEKIKEEADANKTYALQYKEIAQTNEVALKQIEFAYEEFKNETEKLRTSLESEIANMKKMVAELEIQCIMKTKEAFSANVAKDDAISAAAVEIQHLKEENASNISKILELESQNLLLKENLEKEHERWRSSQNNYERQVILQSETIQELSKASQNIASLQHEMTELKKKSDAFKSQNELLKSSLETERLSLLKAKEDAEKKLEEANEQNKILHRQLESLHLKYVDKELGYGKASSSDSLDSENDLQNVVSYLRRGKEIAELEVSLLRQEKLRVQTQLDMALKSSEKAQTLLSFERETAKQHLHSEEEFNSLKLQVAEINLLRESNAELRAENKHNFEECQRLNEDVMNVRAECDRLVQDKEIAIQDYRQEVDMLKSDKLRLEQKISELDAKYKDANVDKLKHVKAELQTSLEKMRERVSEIDNLKRLLMERQESLDDRDRKLVKCQKELDDQQKKIAGLIHIERNMEQLVKENEHLLNENQSLLNQLEESASAKKLNVGSSSETNDMEKDTRIQMLEKLVEKERECVRREKEENKREKARRMKNEKSLLDHVQIIIQERLKLEEEIKNQKLNVRKILESCDIASGQLPSDSALEVKTVSYILAIDKYEEAVNNAIVETDSGISLPVDSSHSEAPINIPGHQATRATTKTGTSGIHFVDIKEKALAKTNTEARKIVRKLNRPDLETTRKRSSSLSAPEIKDENSQQDFETDGLPLSKKAKGSESPLKVSERQVVAEHAQSTITVMEDILLKSAETSGFDTDEKLIYADTGSKHLDMDANIETDIVSSSLDKSDEGMCLIDEPSKCEELLELSQPVSPDEEMEEGEMAPDDLEMLPDESVYIQLEPAAEGELTDTDEGLESLVQNDSTVIGEIITNDSGKVTDEKQGADLEEGQFSPSAGDADSAETQVDTASLEKELHGSHGNLDESLEKTDEGHGSRSSSRIAILEIKQNAQPRQAGMPSQLQNRGAGRGGTRRVNTRGRGGRRATSADREQRG